MLAETSPAVPFPERQEIRKFPLIPSARIKMFASIEYDYQESARTN